MAEKKKMGRPRVIDKQTFERLCEMMSTQEEIASFFRCHIDTVNNFCKREYGTTFSEIYKTLSATGKISLRRYQWRMAETNVAMAIWLGKQYLDQKDFSKVETQELTKVDTFLRALEDSD